MSRHWWHKSRQQVVGQRILTDGCWLGRGRHLAMIWIHLKGPKSELPFWEHSWNAWRALDQGRKTQAEALTARSIRIAVSGPEIG